MFTLQEILERETRVFLDTSVLSSFYDGTSSFEEADLIKESDSVIILSDVLDEVRAFRTAISKVRKKIKKAKRVTKSGESGLHYELSDKCNNIEIKTHFVKRLLSILRERVINLGELQKYQTFREILFYLEDNLRLKKQHSDNRTDESLVAAALFLTIYGKGNSAIVSGDSDIQRLLNGFLGTINRKELIPYNERIVRGLNEKRIRVYFRIPGTQQYKIGLDSSEAKLYYLPLVKEDLLGLVLQQLIYLRDDQSNLCSVKAGHLPHVVFSP
ncbi:MAG: hypothetical protein QXF25_02805 [Candidatus Pacearchaeota archaeon]